MTREIAKRLAKWLVVLLFFMVGATSEVEMKEKKIEDHLTRAAEKKEWFLMVLDLV